MRLRRYGRREAFWWCDDCVEHGLLELQQKGEAMEKDIQAIIEDFRLLPSRGIVTVKAEHVRLLLEYIETLETMNLETEPF